MYKSDWADLRFGFVHSTDMIEQKKSVYHNQDTSIELESESYFKTSSSKDVSFFKNNSVKNNRVCITSLPDNE